jgi:hypothetical protein
VALIVLMTIELLVVAIASVALMLVAILVAMMLLVAQFTATRGREMSCLLFFLLLFALSYLLKNANRLFACLILLKESDELEQVRGHYLVCIRKLELMRFGLREEDFSLFSCAVGISMVWWR